MSFNLLDAAKGLFTNELVSKASSFLGESEGGVTKAINGILPAVISGITQRASSADGAAGILNMATEQHQSGLLDNISGFLGGDNGSMLTKGAGLLSGLFGDKVGGITSLISNFAGIKGSSVTSLLGMAAPMVLGLLGKHASTTGLNASGLASMLSSQSGAVAGAMPAGLNLSSVFSGAAGKATAAVHTATSSAKYAAEEISENTGGPLKWLLPVLALALAAAAAWYFMGKGCGKNDGSTVNTADTALHATTGENAAVAGDTAAIGAAEGATSGASHESMKVKLPGGIELDAYKGGIEDKLVSFLTSNWSDLGEDSLKKIWFDFDNLNFKTASAELLPESEKQLDNITAILKAFPMTKIKIGGYTDATGDAAKNLKLSDDRAKAAKAGLDKRGVGAQVTGAEGYGSQFAKFPATASEADRITDRHVSLSVRK